MEEPIRSQGSFIDCSRMYILQGVVAQQRWRVGELLHRLLTFLKPFLNHPYHNVRSRLGAVLTNIFAFDVEFDQYGNANKSSPHEEDFIKETLPLLSCLQETNSASATTEDKESAQRLLQTLSKWISSSSASHVSSVQSSIFSFLPYLLGYEWFDKDPQLARDCQASLSCLSRSQHTKESIKVLVQEVSKTLSAASWKTRVSCLDFLQAMIFNNFILFCSSNVDTNVSDMRNSVIKMVLECLNDPHLEVRVKAAQVHFQELNRN